MKSDNIKTRLPTFNFGKFDQKTVDKKNLGRLLAGKVVLDKPSFIKLNQSNLTAIINQSTSILQKLAKQDINFINKNLVNLPNLNNKNLTIQVLNVLAKSSNKQLSLNYYKIDNNLPLQSSRNITNFINLLEKTNSMEQTFKDSTNTNWRLALIPWIDNNTDSSISLLKLLIREKDKKKSKSSKIENSGSRFIFELEFSGIGPLILDCLYFEDKKTILLLIKTIRDLEKNEKKELIAKFVDPLVAIGWFGRINFIVEKNMQSILFIKKDNNGMII